MADQPDFDSPTPQAPITSQSSGVLIILPTLNEVQNIGPLLEGIGRELAGTAHTVCIIDDGSTDGTVAAIHNVMAGGSVNVHLIERKKTGRGSQRGSALLAGLLWGLRHTSHQAFVEMDGDLSHRPEELRAGLRYICAKEYDVAIASKYAPGGEVINRPLGRRLVSRVCSVAVSRVISGQIKDYSNGYRFYTRGCAEIIANHKIRYGSPIYLTEALAMWLKEGMRIVEFPSLYVGRNEGLSKLRFIDLIKASLAVFEIGWRYHVRGFARLPIELGVEPLCAKNTDVFPVAAPSHVTADLNQPT